jgi:hypothetical protein
MVRYLQPLRQHAGQMGRQMFERVQFSATAINDGTRGVSFVALVEGRPIKCSISAESLEIYFHAAPEAHEAAFERHREEIEGATEALIRARGISSGELKLELRDLQGSMVAFGRSLRATTDLNRQPPLKG